jgi:hypothetical protein
MMVLLVFEFQDKLSASRLADALHALRMAARKETKDLMWKSEHMGHYLVFLDRLERLGEGALGPSSGNNGSVPMDVDPPAKRQRTDGVPFLWVEVIWMIVLMERDRLFISASTLPSAASTDVNQRLPQQTGTTVPTATTTAIIITTCRTAPSGARTAIILIFYHSHPRIRRPHFTVIIHL